MDSLRSGRRMTGGRLRRNFPPCRCCNEYWWHDSALNAPSSFAAIWERIYYFFHMFTSTNCVAVRAWWSALHAPGRGVVPGGRARNQDLLVSNHNLQSCFYFTPLEKAITAGEGLHTLYYIQDELFRPFITSSTACISRLSLKRHRSKEFLQIHCWSGFPSASMLLLCYSEVSGKSQKKMLKVFIYLFIYLLQFHLD